MLIIDDYLKGQQRTGKWNYERIEELKDWQDESGGTEFSEMILDEGMASEEWSAEKTSELWENSLIQF